MFEAPCGTRSSSFDARLLARHLSKSSADRIRTRASNSPRSHGWAHSSLLLTPPLLSPRSLGFLGLLVVQAVQSFEMTRASYERQALALSNTTFHWVQTTFGIDGSQIVREYIRNFPVAEMGACQTKDAKDGTAPNLPPIQSALQRSVLGKVRAKPRVCDGAGSSADHIPKGGVKLVKTTPTRSLLKAAGRVAHVPCSAAPDGDDHDVGDGHVLHPLGGRLPDV